MEKAVIKILSLLLVSLGFTGCVSVTLPVVAVPHIRGQVVDAATHQPVPNAHITVNDTPTRQAVTHLDGTFSIGDWRRWEFLTVGDHPERNFFSMTIDAPGYPTQTTQWTDETPEVAIRRN
jgi:hypothetical protein